MSATARPGPRLAGTDVIKQPPGGAVDDPENARLADKEPCPLVNSLGDILKWKKKARRRHKRCNEDTGIVYSIFNQTEPHAAVARNYSRFGMYFESDRPLTSGTIIVIRILYMYRPAPVRVKNQHAAATFFNPFLLLTCNPSEKFGVHQRRIMKKSLLGPPKLSKHGE